MLCDKFQLENVPIAQGISKKGVVAGSRPKPTKLILSMFEFS